MNETRKIAAILVADVVGFSRLTGADEEGTLARLRTLRSDLIDPTIFAHHGRVVKRTGDGALVEFRSVVDAVRCAIELQTSMVERNAGLPPKRRIEFRIGIHLGDVVEESDGDLMGDGVNIAARLEGIGKPGTICLSEQAYWQVKGRLAVAVSDLGEQILKNIAEPVRVYSLQIGAPTQAKSEKPPATQKKRFMLLMLAAGIGALIVAAGSAWNVFGVNRLSPAAVENLTMVVLPFANLSGDPSQDYLADVVTDQLTTYISRIPGTFVIARNTAFTYKGKATDVRQIGKDLGVRYAVEGSVQTAGARVRVNTQLINSETGTHLWAEEFDHDRADLLQMEDDIVTRLARTLQIQLADIEAARLKRAHPVIADVQELAMRCQAAYLGIAILNAAEASFRPCQQALEVDPNNVVALAALSIQASGRVSSSNSSDRRADIAQADELASRALAIDPNSPDAHYSKGSSFQVERRFEEAKAEYERAIALNPSQMNAYQGLSLATLNTGQPEEVIALVEKAIRLSPRDPLRTSWFVLEGLANIMLRRDGQALELLRRAATANPKPIVPQAWLAAALALTGREAEARETLERYLSMPEARTKTIAAFKKQRNSDNANYLDMRERIYQGLRKAGMPEE